MAGQALMMTEEATREAWEEFSRTGDRDVRNKLVRRYYSLARMFAEKTYLRLGGSVALEELESAATLGLMDAVERFELKRRVKFETFCSQRIQGAILDEVRQQDHVPRVMRKKMQRLQRAQEQLARTMKCEPSERELAKAARLSVEEVRYVMVCMGRHTVSIDRRWQHGEKGDTVARADILQDERGPDPVRNFQVKELVELAKRYLNEMERNLLVMYYIDELTMREIGEVLDVSEARVSQIHSGILQRLRKKLAG